MSRCQLSLPVFIRPRIAPFQDTLQLFVRPGVQIDRFDSTDVSAHPSMDARASDAHKHAQVPACPSRMFVPLAICAYFIPFKFDKCLQCLRVLGSPVRAGAARHVERLWGKCVVGRDLEGTKGDMSRRALEHMYSEICSGLMMFGRALGLGLPGDHGCVQNGRLPCGSNDG
jgi:hypothetical protein